MLLVPGLELVQRDDSLFVGAENLLAGGNGLLELLLQTLLALRDLAVPLGQEFADAVHDLLPVSADPSEQRDDQAIEFPLCQFGLTDVDAGSGHRLSD
ncbi:MAG: hypothetical protein CO113_18460 [Elusimicrobia bacterium CG_4_9_14_3_um_filter_62_55]|nr:MAG: hypothetical protein COR54_04480 [Elusimicrobia bacterium CG22_combo_CG10-13_8_21_14_all_63_91]PJA18282.1 MAG: hypothetical protein COX66_01620 [Elusimicrobia bacterium CG_4_10_14_0_2_um_filter_63_34]PJB23423.1 MAG: hypothetical protein CO113_18460 [Elusimicrobia bacterium CG_4_9_14_3_um_filter_62_55]